MTVRPQIIVDARALFGANARRGIGRYTTGLCHGLKAAGANVVVVTPPGKTSCSDLGDLSPLPADHRTLVRLLNGDVPSVFHSGSLFEFPAACEIVPRAVNDYGGTVSATLYDAIPFLEPDRYQSIAALRRFHQARATIARSCDHLLAISEYSARSSIEAMGLRPERVCVVGTGVDEQFRPATDAHASWRRVSSAFAPLREDFILSVSGNDDRKNSDGLIRAYSLLPRDLRARHQLVIVGYLDSERIAGLGARSNAAGVASDVLLLGEVADELLVELYRSAALSVFPALSEGFGLPAAEAAACGCPTITSDRTAVPEVLNWQPSTFDPLDPVSLASLIERSLLDDTFRSDLRRVGAAAARRWRWSAVAQRAMSAWEQSLPARRGRLPAPRQGRSTAPPPRPTIALVGPFGGSPSGIGTYNERLLPELDDIAEVTCLVEKFQGEAPLGTDGRRFPAGALGRHLDPASFDHVVYTIGNSPFHITSVLQLAGRISGHVWLHEARLVELHVGVAHLLKNQPWAERHLDQVVAAEAGASVVEAIRTAGGHEAMLDVPMFRQRGVRMLTPTLLSARSLVVSSALAAELVDLALTALSLPRPRPPVLVLPHAFPTPVARRDTPPAKAEIAVLGWMSTSKGLARLADILRRLRQTIDARLVFIGRALDGSLEELNRVAHASGVADAIEVCGFLPEQELRDRVARCRVGVRLTDHSDGEMSGAIADLVSLGVPVVTNLPTVQASDGVIAIPGATDEQLIAALAQLLDDDHRWLQAHRAALALAHSWTFAAVAHALVDWVRATDG